MPKTSETPRDLRKKLSRSVSSRNLFKNKQRETQYEVKKLKNCLSAMTISRDKWRIECKKNKVRAKDLQNELSNAIKERDELMAKLKDTDSLVQKKRKN